MRQSISYTTDEVEMLEPIIAPEVWAQTHKLEIKQVKCLCCKKHFIMNIPVASKKFRGFKTPKHGCPEEYTQYLLAPNKETTDLFTVQAL